VSTKKQAKKTAKSIIKQEREKRKEFNENSTVKLGGSVAGMVKDKLNPQITDDNIPYSQEEIKKDFDEYLAANPNATIDDVRSFRENTLAKKIRDNVYQPTTASEANVNPFFYQFGEEGNRDATFIQQLTNTIQKGTVGKPGGDETRQILNHWLQTESEITPVQLEFVKKNQKALGLKDSDMNKLSKTFESYTSSDGAVPGEVGTNLSVMQSPVMQGGYIRTEQGGHWIHADPLEHKQMIDDINNDPNLTSKEKIAKGKEMIEDFKSGRVVYTGGRGQFYGPGGFQEQAEQQIDVARARDEAAGEKLTGNLRARNPETFSNTFMQRRKNNFPNQLNR
tara:strand:+ start:291 stop:1301 length:1011 start_codon:yes stop_codon:yes gene_type:complete